MHDEAKYCPSKYLQLLSLMYFCSVVKYALKIFRIPIPSEMSAYVVRNPGFTDAPLSVANEGPETDFKSYPPKPWFKKKRLILGSVIIGIVLAVGIVLLVHFLAKDSSSKSMLPQFNGMLFYLTIKSSLTVHFSTFSILGNFTHSTLLTFRECGMYSIEV